MPMHPLDGRHSIGFTEDIVRTIVSLADGEALLCMNLLDTRFRRIIDEDVANYKKMLRAANDSIRVARYVNELSWRHVQRLELNVAPHQDAHEVRAVYDEGKIQLELPRAVAGITREQ